MASAMQKSPSMNHKSHSYRNGSHHGRSSSMSRQPSQQTFDYYDEVTHLFPILSQIQLHEVVNATTGVASTSLPTQVFTKSKALFLEKYQAMMSDGPSKLKVVSDFDFTITKYHIFKPVESSTTANQSTITLSSPSTAPNANQHPAMNTPDDFQQVLGSPLSHHIQQKTSSIQRLRSLSNLSESSTSHPHNDSLNNSMHGRERRLRSSSNLSSCNSNSVSLSNLSNILSNLATSTPVVYSKHRGISCHGVLEDCNLFSKEFHEEAIATFKKYYPIEADPHISYESKFQHMIEWVNASHHTLLHKAGLTFPLLKKAVYEAVDEHRIELRGCVQDYFQQIAHDQIPMLIFSAGIADILEKVLEHSFSHQHLDLLQDVHVVSNKCIFELHDEAPKENAVAEHKHVDASPHPNASLQRVSGWGNASKAYGKLIGFYEPLIHVLNKRSSSFLTTCSFFHSENETNRMNVIVLGDSPGDILMTDGMSYDPSKCLKIGFLNDKIADKFDHYLDIYDLVIVGEEAGFEIPLEILKNIGNYEEMQNTILADELLMMHRAHELHSHDHDHHPIVV
jgi:cytosolic 5'-nucleotidase 3